MASLPRLKRWNRADYQPKAQRIVGVKRKPWNKRGWGPGWPNPDGPIVQIQANRVGFRVRAEIAPLIRFLFLASNALGYDIRRRSEEDGGVGSFFNRAIKNSKPPVGSIHSLGTAIDQNSRGNVRFADPLRSVTPPRIVTLWESAGFFWGGRFGKGWVDPMHFEYLFPPSEVEKDLANAKAVFRQMSGSDELYPTQSQGSLNAAMVRVLQWRLQVHGYPCPDSGIFDDVTEAQVRTFQDETDWLIVDGIVGPQTWGFLNSDPVEESEDADHEEPDPGEEE